jgi:hypothetical protein
MLYGAECWATKGQHIQKMSVAEMRTHHHYHYHLYLFIIILFIYLFILPSYSLLSLIFEIFDLMLFDWVSFLAYPNLFGIKGFVVVVV